MLVRVVWYQQTHASFLGLERSTNLPRSHSYSAIVLDWKLRIRSKLLLPLCSLVCRLRVPPSNQMDAPGSLPCWTKTIKLLNNITLLAKSLESLYFCLSIPLSSRSLCLSLPSSPLSFILPFLSLPHSLFFSPWHIHHTLVTVVWSSSPLFDCMPTELIPFYFFLLSTFSSFSSSLQELVGYNWSWKLQPWTFK